MFLRRLVPITLAVLLIASFASQILARGVPPFSPGVFIVVSKSANARSSADTTADVVETLAFGTTVNVTDRVEGSVVNGNSYWYVVTLPDTGATAYVHSSLMKPVTASVAANTSTTTTATTGSAPTNLSPAPAALQPVVSAPAAASFTCPRNCAGAVAMGLTAQQAATCPGLDRDHDGQACYGN